MADDLSVVNSARVSFGNRHSEMQEGDDRLINFLMRDHHGTPFEHNAFRFHVKLPIFVAREWVRHRIGSFNEMSGRYTTLPAEWYVPEEKDVRVRIGKPGNYTYEPADANSAQHYIRLLQTTCSASYLSYVDSLESGIAPEVARNFLHVNHYTEWYWTVNARSMMNFLALRNAPTAQREIQQYAKFIETSFKEVMPVTYASFIVNGRIAP
jgi:thymidylate synthase (FAD)